MTGELKEDEILWCAIDHARRSARRVVGDATVDLLDAEVDRALSFAPGPGVSRKQLLVRNWRGAHANAAPQAGESVPAIAERLGCSTRQLQKDKQLAAAFEAALDGSRWVEIGGSRPAPTGRGEERIPRAQQRVLALDFELLAGAGADGRRM